MKVVLFDRDGTLIVDPPDLRVNSVSKIKLFPDTVEALTLLARADCAIIIVTNQAGIAEGLLTIQDFDIINGKVIELLETSGLKVLKTYMCPHDELDNCDCRKPKPKMLQDAARELGLDLSKTYMIGDRQSDILAGRAAGTKTILVETSNTPTTSAEADYTVPNLLSAVRIVLNN